MLHFITVEDNIEKQPFPEGKTPALEQIFSKETPTQLFAYKYCKTFKNSFFL